MSFLESGRASSTPAPRPLGSTREPETPRLHPLNASKDGVAVGDPVGLSTLLAGSPQPVCLVTFARFYDSALDVLPVEQVLDRVVQRLTRNFVILVKPGSPRAGNSLTQVADAIRRLGRRMDVTERVYEPSDDLIAFLGIGDNRGGLRNALHRYDAGKLTRHWIAAVADPLEDHYNGQDSVLRLRRS